MKTISLEQKASSFIICDKNARVLFTVHLIDKQEELVDRMSFLIAAYSLMHGINIEDFRILVEPIVPVMKAISSRVKSLLEELKGTFDSNFVRITKREKEVLSLVCSGHSNKEIANILFISERTAKFHVSSILAKYDVTDRQRLVSKVLGNLKSIELLEDTMAVRIGKLAKEELK